MHTAISDYLLEWQDVKDAKALAFLRESLSYVQYSPLDIGQIQKSLMGLEDLYPKVSFCLKNQPISNNQSIAIEWEMRCHSDKVQLNIPEKLTLTGSDFIHITGSQIKSIDLYFDPTPFAKMLRQHESMAGRYQRSGLTPQIAQEIAAHAERLMQNEQLYLRNNLTLATLANIVGIHSNHLSQAINQQRNRSFNHWLSGYRIQAAVDMLQTPSMLQRSILDIALSVGFNSKSVFYSAFKASMGVTPSQFRKSYIEKAEKSAG